MLAMVCCGACDKSFWFGRGEDALPASRCMCAELSSNGYVDGVEFSMPS